MFSSLNSKYKILAGFVILLLLLVGVAVFSSRNNSSPVVPSEQGIVVQPDKNATYQRETDQTTIAIIASTTQQVTLRGESVCLPHRDTSGPTTMECALGIKTIDGNYYALDTSNGAYRDLPTGIAVVVKGEFVPIEMISSNLGKIYNVKGIIRTSAAETVPVK